MRKRILQSVGSLLLAMLLAGCVQENQTIQETPTESSFVQTEEETTTEEATSAEETTAEETVPEETTMDETSAEETSAEENTIEETTTEESLPVVLDCPNYSDYANYEEFDRARDAYYSKLVADAWAEGRKIVYLTFDDGSGDLTPTVLDTLDEYNVKATFFVVADFTTNPSTYNDILERGNSLGSHTIAHARATIYKSLENFQYAVDSMNDYVYNQTGVTPYLFRFPGGTSTSFSNTEDMLNIFIPYLKSKNMIHYDWNVSSGDGSGNITAQKVYDNVINGVKNSNYSVVLMHDGSGHSETVAALPQILDTLINEMNCLVVPITRSTVPVQSIK